MRLLLALKAHSLTWFKGYDILYIMNSFVLETEYNFDLPEVLRRTRNSIEATDRRARASKKILNAQTRRDPFVMKIRNMDRVQDDKAIVVYADLADRLYTQPGKFSMVEIKPLVDFLEERRTFLSGELLAKASQ